MRLHLSCIALCTQKEPQPDTFVAYGPVYCMVRDRVADAMFGRNLKQLESNVRIDRSA